MIRIISLIVIISAILVSYPWIPKPEENFDFEQILKFNWVSNWFSTEFLKFSFAANVKSGQKK